MNETQLMKTEEEAIDTDVDIKLFETSRSKSFKFDTKVK